MNRAIKRKMDKNLKSKLTDDQYKDFKDKTVQEYIEKEIRKSREKTALLLSESLTEVLSKKEYRISENRKNNILIDFIETLNRKVEESKGEK
jgi:hypothetical protein